MKVLIKVLIKNAHESMRSPSDRCPTGSELGRLKEDLPLVDFQ